MKRIIVAVQILLASVVSFSLCNSGVSERLAEIDRLISEAPDSALTELCSIQPSRL